jgi:hypothetical protein
MMHEFNARIIILEINRYGAIFLKYGIRSAEAYGKIPPMSLPGIPGIYTCFTVNERIEYRWFCCGLICPPGYFLRTFN